jgi:2-dehydro-3-deoxyphosphogluconate aldolase / (4S)-4-hydroxy-2-oxoglutarate aldolase
MKTLDTTPIIGIIRGIPEEHLLPTLEAAISGGLSTIEITMNTANAEKLIQLAATHFSKECAIGAGTVTTIRECTEALSAGARYIVAPHFESNIASLCKDKEIPYFPGALTPTEIFNAWSNGAEMVKVFPVSALGGIDYIKNLRGPYHNIALLACGGVTLNNMESYFEAGVNAIAIGTQIFKPDWIKSKDYKSIETAARNFVSKAIQN